MFHKILLGALFFSSTFAFLTPQNGLTLIVGQNLRNFFQQYTNIKFVGIDKHERVIDVAATLSSSLFCKYRY